MRKLIREIVVATVVGVLLHCHISWDKETDGVDAENQPRPSGVCSYINNNISTGEFLVSDGKAPAWTTLSTEKAINGDVIYYTGGEPQWVQLKPSVTVETEPSDW